MRALHLSLLAVALGSVPAGAQFDGSIRGELRSGLGTDTGNRSVTTDENLNRFGGGGGGQDLTRGQRPVGGFIGQGPPPGISGSGDLTQSRP